MVQLSVEKASYIERHMSFQRGEASSETLVYQWFKKY